MLVSTESDTIEYCLMLSNTDDYNKAKLQDEAYKKISQALMIMGDSAECDYLIANDFLFKEHYLRLLLCVEWYEARRSAKEAKRVLTKLSPLPRRCTEYRTDDKELFPIPCLIEHTPFPECILNLRAPINVMTLSACKAIGEIPIMRPDNHRSFARGCKWRFLGVAKGLDVLLHGHTLTMDFAVVDSESCRGRRVMFGNDFLVKSAASIDISEGVITFHLSRSDTHYDTKREPGVLPDGREFHEALTHFLRDLARIAGEEAMELGGMIRDLDEVKVNILFPSKLKYRDKFLRRPPNFRRLELLDGAGPSTGQTSDPQMDLIAVGTQEGKPNMDDGGENKPPDREFNSGDIPTVNPGHSHTS